MSRRATSFILVLPLAAAALAAAPAAAESATWKLDPFHSDLSFRAQHMVISRVPGKFTKFEGTIVGDLAAPTSAKVELKIDTASIDTGTPQRDAHLKSPDFFDAAKYPEITFRSTKIVDKGNGAFDVTGDLTMH